MGRAPVKGTDQNHRARKLQTLRPRKGEGTDPPLEPAEGAQPYPHSDLGPPRMRMEFSLPELAGKISFCLEPLSLRSFVKTAVENQYTGYKSSLFNILYHVYQTSKKYFQ